jgi:microcystin degradation protein MlrC
MSDLEARPIRRSISTCTGDRASTGEGERCAGSAVIGERIPLVASLDYHTNMTPEMVRHSSAMVGYRTYPHIDMAETGGRAARLLDRLLKDRRPLHKAYRQLDFLIPLVWQCTLMEPAKGIFELIAEIERGSDRSGGPSGSHNQGIVSITHTPGFPPADIAQCGPALVVYGHDKEAAEAQADRLAGFIREQEPAFAGRLYTPDEAVVEAMRLARTATKPIMLADIQDNPGAGGTSDTVGLLRALIAHRAQGAVIGMMVDPEAAEAATAAGEGAMLDRGIGAAVGFAGEMPVERPWRVVRLGSGSFTGSGPMYGGAKFRIGPMALLTDEESGVSAVSRQSASRQTTRKCSAMSVSSRRVLILASNRRCISAPTFSRLRKRSCASTRPARMSAIRRSCRTAICDPASGSARWDRRAADYRRCWRRR